MWTQPTAQQRPEPLHRIHMHFTKAVAIFISSAFASSMVHTLMAVSPGLQTSIHAVRIRINQCTGNDGAFDEGLDGLLLHVGHQIDHDLTTALHHPKNWRSLFLQGPSASLAFEPALTSFSALALHYFRLSFMTRNHIGFVALHFV